MTLLSDVDAALVQLATVAAEKAAALDGARAAGNVGRDLAESEIQSVARATREARRARSLAARLP